MDARPRRGCRRGDRRKPLVVAAAALVERTPAQTDSPCAPGKGRRDDDEDEDDESSDDSDYDEDTNWAGTRLEAV